MSENRAPHLVAVVFSLVVFGAGLVYFDGFSSTRSYPPYSSLNAQKNGAKLLFAALAGTGKLSVERNYRPLSLLRVKNSAILFLGITPASALQWTDSNLTTLERLASAGNRVAIVLTGDPLDWKQLANNKSPLLHRWRLPIEPGSSPLRLNSGNGWQFEEAGLLGKKFGAGVVLFLLHAEHFTNQPVSETPWQTILPVLVGPYASVIFDESHLGIEETGSVAGLARRYRLQGLIAGLLLLAGLFIWKQAIRFSPLVQEPGNLPQPSMRDVLGSLLAENISSPDLIPLCIDEWNRYQPKHLLSRDAVTSEEPVDAYRRIQEELALRKPIRA